MEIDKRNVRNSIWIPIPGVFILLMIGMFFNVLTDNYVNDYMAVLTASFGLMVIGIIVWFPALLFCLLLEHFTINERTSVAGLFGILVIEALVPVIVFHIIIGGIVIEITPITLLIAFLAQAMRWGYLWRKQRMFLTHHKD